jgi:hypothetical protein
MPSHAPLTPPRYVRTFDYLRIFVISILLDTFLKVPCTIRCTVQCLRSAFSIFFFTWFIFRPNIFKVLVGRVIKSTRKALVFTAQSLAAVAELIPADDHRKASDFTVRQCILHLENCLTRFLIREYLLIMFVESFVGASFNNFFCLISDPRPPPPELQQDPVPVPPPPELQQDPVPPPPELQQNPVPVPPPPALQQDPVPPPPVLQQDPVPPPPEGRDPRPQPPRGNGG